MGKTGREETGDTEKQWAFQYLVAMETGNAQYLSNIEETYDFKILKGTDPEIVKVSGSKAYLFFKRAFDIVAAIVVGLVLLLFMPIIAAAIKLDSKGPVLFKQERVGKERKVFTMYKFRSMRVNSQADTAWSRDRDSRITPFGALIRKFSLDELPQFFNVLKGEMSVVGPRPELPYFVEQYKDNVPLYMVKHQVKPGITGWAQVNGYRGDTSIEKRIEHDIWYIENWSMYLDVKIIFMTIFGGMINKEKNLFADKQEQKV